MIQRLQSGYNRVTCNLTFFLNKLQPGYTLISYIMFKINNLQVKHKTL